MTAARRSFSVANRIKPVVKHALRTPLAFCHGDMNGTPHHWIIGDHGEAYCKRCGDERTFIPYFTNDG